MNMGNLCILFFYRVLEILCGRGDLWGRDSSEGWLRERERGENERCAAVATVRCGAVRCGAVRCGGS